MSGPAFLDPLRFALRGSSLVEASAGTGKTYTIAALYLRLVLGHGGAHGFARPLSPPEVLVVTFTDAATKELRDRIRARLNDAAQAFMADPSTLGSPARSGDAPGVGARAALPVADDPQADIVDRLRATVDPADWPACARQLRLAADNMDEAAVSTIHGWCHRMLREHAFDSGSLFTQTLETDQRALWVEVLRDYWRCHCHALDDAGARQWNAWFADPDALGAPLKDLLRLRDRLPPGAAPALALCAAREESARLIRALKAEWLGRAGGLAALADLLDGAVAAKQLKLPRRKDWLARLRAWAEGDAPRPVLTDVAWDRLSPAGVLANWQGDAAAATDVAGHPALAAVDALRQRLDALPDGRDAALCHATHWVAQRLDLEQQRRAQMGFDDLLTRLDSALQGPNGARLAALIRQQFPVALIDEFQDTDPVQYRIFDAIYRIGDPAPDTAVVLIGDPKQAIYGFRGADIHTYLAARRATAGRHATLGVNFRSTEAMVRAVNQVFLRAEQRCDGRGAFLFRRAGDNPLPFVPVGARGRRERLQVDGLPVTALNCWVLDDGAPVAAGVHVERMAQACAGEITRLLTLGQQGRATFVSTTEAAPARALQPGDVAVLVNVGREARAVRQALAARGVRSVYLSDKDSVYQSAVAADLQRWLAACAEPDNDRLLRAALASATLGLGHADLDRLNHDEAHWESRVQQFQAFRQLWRRQGVLPMLRRLMHAFAVPRRLLGLGDERALTDLLHLAELLQQASTLLDGEHALIRHLAEQRADAEAASDARQLRLESDADLVKVVTVHKSKGLEYPLVFLPFASAFRAAKASDLPLSWHTDGGERAVALNAADVDLARVDDERLGEDLRKLYVALTRARHATWLGAAALVDWPRSALGCLLAGEVASQPTGAGPGPVSLRASLQGLAANGADIAVTDLPDAGALRFVASDAGSGLGPELPLPDPRAPWWVASFSALRRAEAPSEAGATPALAAEPAVPPSPASAEEDIYFDSRSGPPPSGWASDAGDGAMVDPRALGDRATRAAGRATVSGHRTSAAVGPSLHDFPRGAGPGSFLHGLLEWVARAGFAQVWRAPEALRAQVERRCLQRGWGAWSAPLTQWLLDWIDRPLAPGAAAVGAGAAVDDGRAARIALPRPRELGPVQVEMEFWFPAEGVDVQRLDALVTRQTVGGAPRPALAPLQLNGMLKGYVDLVFEHGGRFFVADHKSNWLGPADADYTVQAMAQAVLHHRYDLQVVLYTLALHRLLASRLADYDYDRHVGGAVLLFLRGHAAPTHGLHWLRPDRGLIERLDALFSGEAVAP